MDNTILWPQKCKSCEKFEFIKQDVQSLFQGIANCNKIMNEIRTYVPVNPEIRTIIEQQMSLTFDDLANDVDEFYRFLKEEMVDDLRYFHFLEKEVESIQSQLELQHIQFSHEIDRLSREYFYVDHMNDILGFYTDIDEYSDIACKFSELEKHFISLKLSLQQSQEKNKNDKLWKKHDTPLVSDLNNKTFEINDLKAQLQDKNIAISELKKLIENMKGKYVNTKSMKPTVVPIRTREPKRTANQSVATTHKRIVGSKSTIPKPRSTFRRIYENVSKTCNWWYTKLTPPEYKWLVEIIMFIIDSGCTKHMTRYLKLLNNFMEKFLCTVRFGNDQFALILGYGDLVQGNVTIKWVYYVKGLNHNLFFVGQFCDADLEVAFWKSSFHVHDLKGNDLLTGSRGTDLYSITLQKTTSLNSICLMAKASSSQAWL
ncbi:hypothetical protein Tco_0944109 [Tanacetum coccineum]